MPLLVTGATGRTGAGVVRNLLAAGEEVRVLVRDADKAKKTFEDQDGVEIVRREGSTYGHPSSQ